MKNQSGIYEILNTVNGKRYIGSATSSVSRKSAHWKDLQRNTHPNQKLQRAWNKYGETAFVFRVIQPCPKEQLLFQEQRAIHGFLPEYNIALVAGAPMRGRQHSQETKQLRSIAHLGQPNMAIRGVKHSPERIEKRIAPLRGRKQAPEHIAKRVAATVDRPRTPEHCANISNALRGVKKAPRTPEHCANISASKKGKKSFPRTPEYRAKVSASLCAYFASQKVPQ